MIRHAAQMTTETKEKIRGGDGTVEFRHYFKPEELNAKSRLCAMLSLPPGTSIGTHEHMNEDEIYIILRGEGEIDDGKKRETVSAGDAVLTGNGESHSLRNTGAVPLELVAVIMQYPA